MALNEAQLMVVPGGPGVVGAIIAGENVVIDPDGTINAPNGGGVTSGVFKIITKDGLIVTPPEGTGEVDITYSLPLPIPFYAGTRLVVANASAPPGYTKITSFDNGALRVMPSGGGNTGGQIGFTSVYTSITPTGSVQGGSLGTTSGNTGSGTWTPSGTFSQGNLSLSSSSLNTDQIGNHYHQIHNANDGGGSFNLSSNCGNINLQGTYYASDTGGGGGHSHGIQFNQGWTGNGISHTHSYSATLSVGTGTYTGNTLSLGVKYVDALICEKV